MILFNALNRVFILSSYIDKARNRKERNLNLREPRELASVQEPRTKRNSKHAIRQEMRTTALHNASLRYHVARKQDQQTRDQPGRINPEVTAAE
jgi:hypothetical protein